MLVLHPLVCIEKELDILSQSMTVNRSQFSRTLKNISLHVHVHVLCTHALICSSLMCCNRQCARTDILHPQPSSYIAFCMYCHMCQCASAIYTLNWISMATHALPLGFQRRTLIAATNTRRNFFHTSSSSHCLLCFILVPSIFCSSPNQIHPPPFLLTAQEHILCTFQAWHIAQLMTNNLHIRICFTYLLDFSPFPKPAPQPSHHLGPERLRR